MGIERLDIYKKNIEDYKKEELRIGRSLTSMVWLRVLVFVLIPLEIYFFREFDVFRWPIMVVLIGAFLYLVKRHSNLLKKREFVKNLHEINEGEIAALSGDISAFDSGDEYLEGEHAYSYDLDLFGNQSIFQLLNRTGTKVGKKHLSETMRVPGLNWPEISSRQGGIKELADKLEWRQEFLAEARIGEEENGNLQELNEWVHEEQIDLGVFSKGIWLTLLPVLSTIFIVLFFFGLISGKLFLLLLIIPGFILSGQVKKVNAYHFRVGKIMDSIRRYGKLLERIESEKWESEKLKSLKENLKFQNKSGGERVGELSKLIEMLDTRSNMLLGVIFNFWLYWDFQFVTRIENWREESKSNFEDWIKVIGEIEVISSLANFSYNNPEYIYPKASDKNSVIKAVGAGHPLIPKDERVLNDFELGKDYQFMLITGANMAGKSTFLRTIGVNHILSLMGSVVVAKEYQFEPIQLYTSMRTTDSLQKHESYFYTELKRLKLIIDQIKSGKRVFIILDEILKGTNSKDKEAGSRKFIENLIKLKAMGIFATHDLSLTNMEGNYPDSVANYCFEVEFGEADLVFDYKLRNGVCQNMNATFLMNKMGITG